MTSSDSETQAPSRKRLRISVASENAPGDASGAAKKARGRPRVDTRDATAADRRRTQIRLAQRAYRQRKETTIVSLKQQSAQLHAIVDEMNKSFTRVNDMALKSGFFEWNASLAREFKQVSDTFKTLVSTANEAFLGSDNSDEHDQKDETQHDLSRTRSSPTETLDIGWGYSAMFNHQGKPATEPGDIRAQNPSNIADAKHTSDPPQDTDLARYRLFPNQDGQYSAESAYISAPPPQTHDSSQRQQAIQFPFGLVNTSSFHTPLKHQTYPLQDSSPLGLAPVTSTTMPPPQFQQSFIPNNLPPILTYSQDETSFARRLMRASLEAAFRLLCTAGARTARANQVFKLSLPHLSLNDIRDKFKIMLSRSIHEDMDFWESPFIHLGGAGTHYPRKDRHGNTIPIKNNWNIRQIGPVERRKVRVERIADGRWQDIDGLDLAEFEGEWFDAHDVQGYLEEHWGCKIDPISSFAEFVIDEDMESNHISADNTRRGSKTPSDALTLTYSSSSKPSSPSQSLTPPENLITLPEPPYGLDMSFIHPHTAASTSNLPKSSTVDFGFDQTLGLDLAPGFDYGFATGNGSHYVMNMDMNLGFLGQEVFPAVSQHQKKTAWLDVDRLINELIKHGVCLGRTPGFRRKDVDFAMRTALVATV